MRTLGLVDTHYYIYVYIYICDILLYSTAQNITILIIYKRKESEDICVYIYTHPYICIYMGVCIYVCVCL